MWVKLDFSLCILNYILLTKRQDDAQEAHGL